MSVTFDMEAAAAKPICPGCGKAFTRKRTNQRYCTPPCQKATTRHASRGPRAGGSSPEVQRRNTVHYTRARWLGHDLYLHQPSERLGFMATVIEAARARDGQLRSILTDPVLLKEQPRADGRINIAKAANAYCRKFWGQGIRAVVHRDCPEPPTGVDGDTVGHVTPQSAPRTLMRDNYRPTEYTFPAYVHRDPKQFLEQIRAMRRTGDEQLQQAA